METIPVSLQSMSWLDNRGEKGPDQEAPPIKGWGKCRVVGGDKTRAMRQVVGGCGVKQRCANPSSACPEFVEPSGKRLLCAGRSRQ